MSLRDELLSVRTKAGALTPAAVVEAATPKTHPLHDRFEWDNRVAGHKYRLVQARMLIRSVRVEYREPSEDDPGDDVRAFHAVRGPSGYTYEPVEEVVEDELATAMVLRDMEREWKTLHRRYARFSEFVEMVRQDLDEAV